jgi:hypothetical protein
MTSKAFGLAQLGNAYADGALSNRNKIINGAMVMAQRGTSGTPTSSGAYVSVDRWNARAATSTGHTAAQSTTSAVGFTNSLVFTTGTGASPAAGDRNWLRQAVEGFNIADLAWGTANAKTITVSFQVRSSLTGTFAAAIVNNDGDRSYPFTFTISSADTFEAKSVTITGPTDGTWGSGNGVGLNLTFDIGSGSTYEGTAGEWNNANKLTVSGATKVIATSGATFYLTGVQLEAGDTATPFEHRSYGQELALCQRYCYAFGNGYRYIGDFTNNVGGNATNAYFFTFPSPMRATPTFLVNGVTIAGSFGSGNQYMTPEAFTYTILRSGFAWETAGLLQTGNYLFTSEL